MKHEFIKSSYCQDLNCVELAQDPETRDVLVAGGTVEVNVEGQQYMRFTPDDLGAFVLGVKAGEFDHLVDMPQAGDGGSGSGGGN